MNRMSCSIQRFGWSNDHFLPFLCRSRQLLRYVSFNSRFADGLGTNPEELVAAAHAGCFSMKLTFVLSAAGFSAEKIETNCEITLEDGSITESHLNVNAKVTGISKEQFIAAVEDAKANCPISKLLNTNITHEAVLA